MKRVLSEPLDKAKEAEEEKRLHLSETFRTADFRDLVDRTHVNVSLVTFLHKLVSCAFNHSYVPYFSIDNAHVIYTKKV